MHRLLQGDVGSGKTVVAALAAAIAIECGSQCAVMVPTEILATQHFAKLVALARAPRRSGRAADRRTEEEGADCDARVDRIRLGGARRRHACGDRVAGAVYAAGPRVIDEQHRFGVEQRRAVRQGRHPDEPTS